MLPLNLQGLVWYIKPVPAIDEPDATLQGEIVWAWKIPLGEQPTETDLEYNARVPGGTGAVFAYFCLN